MVSVVGLVGWIFFSFFFFLVFVFLFVHGMLSVCSCLSLIFVYDLTG